MASQDQNIDHSEIKNSNVQQSQAGRDAVSFNNSRDNQVVIENTFLRLFGRSESNQVDWDWAKLLLEKKQLPEIRKRLTDTLGRERILMDVSIAEQQQWVNRLQADRQLQVNGKNSGFLDPNKLLIETFGRDDIAGKLLILGAPGSGKTTALLSLAEQLVLGAIGQPKTVIPVIFELSTWLEDSQSIEAWIIEQLYDLHGGNRKEKIYEKYLERQVLLPLLDGLDELGLERQKKCTEKLNEFAQTYPQLVVCCRVREFETANIKLSNLNGAICLQELSNGQIEAYFQSINRADLWSEIETNSALQGLLQETAEGESGLLRVPLFIKLLANVYDPQEPIVNKTDLLEKYIERQLSFDQRERDHRKGLQNHRWAYKTVEKEPKLDEMINSLSWVARQLQANNTVELLIEEIQPNWIENQQLYSFYELIPSFFALFTALFPAFYIGKSVASDLGIFAGVLFTSFLVRGWLLGIRQLIPLSWWQKIEPIENIKIPTSKLAIREFKRNWKKNKLTSTQVVSRKWFIFGDEVTETESPNSTVVFTKRLISGFNQELKVRLYPNQGIFNSIKSMVWVTTIVFCYASIISLYLFEEIKEENNFLTSVWLRVLSSLFFGILFGGGLACIQHFILRFILWQSGTIPWNFARFLNYCVERRLLLRVGGRYRFLHRELLDHFAQLPSGTQIK
jgi:hypothetical protein